MKLITIYQEGASPVVIKDDDKQGLESYIKEISSMFDHSNISILQTKFTSVSIRPSKIISIVVEEQTNSTKIEPRGIVIQSKQHSKKKELAEKDEYTLTDE